MLFWFKKKETVLDCFTDRFSCYEYNRPDKAAKFIPEWYKKLGKGNYSDPYKEPYTTMKKCTGFINYFTNSFCLPSPDFIHIRADNEAVDIKSDVLVGHHSKVQYGDFLDDSFHHIKIVTPWLVHSNNKIKFLQSFPTWCQKSSIVLEKFTHIPGIVDFYYQNSTNVNGFVKKPNKDQPAYVMTFEIGAPLVFYTPLEDTKIKFKYHLISREEYSQRAGLLTSTPGNNRLSVTKNLIDKRDSEKKCPFGFK